MFRVLIVVIFVWSNIKIHCQSLRLSPPRANQSLVMIREKPVVLDYDFRMEGSHISYTKDGPEPKSSDNRYTTPISITKPVTIKARVFHPDFEPSQVVKSVFVKRGKKIKTVRISDPDPKYSASGSHTLYDQVFGDMDFKKGYLGYNDSALIAEIYPANKTFISKVNISYLVNQSSWIFGPASVKVTDIKGHIISEQILPDTHIKQNSDHIIFRIGIDKKKYKYLKVSIEPLENIPDWHDGRKNKAWLFIDEVWVE